MVKFKLTRRQVVRQAAGLLFTLTPIAVEQRHHRIVGIDAVRIEVDDEAVFKAADRGKREDLRIAFCLRSITTRTVVGVFCPARMLRI